MSHPEPEAAAEPFQFGMAHVEVCLAPFGYIFSYLISLDDGAFSSNGK
jgi:hypothetical protein